MDSSPATPPPDVNAMKLQSIPILNCIDIIVNNNDDIWIEYSLRFPSLLLSFPRPWQDHTLEDPHKVSLLQLIRSAKTIRIGLCLSLAK